MKEQIKKLRHSKNEEDRRQCLSLLQTYLEKNPSDAEAWYDKASCHDFLGEEQAAEPCYQRCFEIGWRNLPASEQRSFFVGYGSTLRNNLKYAQSAQILEEGIRNFPDFPALKVFLAFAFYSQKQDQKAIELLFKTITEVANLGLDGYDRAIQWYAENLNAHPERRDGIA